MAITTHRKFNIMTYDQALDKKNSLQSDSFTEQEMTFYVFVTPSSHKDFTRYVTDIRGYFGHLTDEEAKLYSLDGLFAVHGLWFDGANIVYKRL
jgi:hypothetical protein